MSDRYGKPLYGKNQLQYSVIKRSSKSALGHHNTFASKTIEKTFQFPVNHGEQVVELVEPSNDRK